jgi:hypothetical protein
MKFRTRSTITLSVLTVSALFWLGASSKAIAQDLESTTYRLISPSVGSPLVGTGDSTNYSQLIDANSVDTFTSTSTLYQIRGGTAEFIEANVPTIQCAETSTTGATTLCTGIPGSDGMQGVCSEPGCYDRAKFEIDAQGNAADTRFAVQVSTTSDFSSNNYYLDSTTRLLKANLLISDFLPKCEWEGTVVSEICNSPNTTWQRYNILGLAPNTTYYLRFSGQKGYDTYGTFAQSEWGPSNYFTTQKPAISLNLDIAPDTTTVTNPPNAISLGTLAPANVITSSDMIVVKVTSNALDGIDSQIKGLNGGILLISGTDIINAVNGDLAALSSGFGIRNNSASNGAENSGTIGSIVVASSPSDFTDSGAPNKVGAPVSSFVALFNSNNMPLDQGVSGFYVKAKAPVAQTAGNYSETLTFIVIGDF